MHSSRRSRGVTTIAVVNAVAGVVTLLFWGLLYLRLFAGSTSPDPVLRTSTAATLGFLVGDVVWAVPLLFLSVVGLWRLRDWGWLAAQMVNVLWVYSMTVVWVRDVYARSVSPGAVLFTPFAVIAIWATAHLWRARSAFSPARRPGSPANLPP
jgi:hypothetical protein